MGAATVVVTRPGSAGRALCEELNRLGQPALWLPAFEFGAAPDEAYARSVLARLADFDLAVFVSPQSARATATLLDVPWPRGTEIAAVGAGTRAALHEIAGAGAAAVIAPAGDDDAGGSGSEALWPLLQSMPPPRRVLLLRAQGGREWLGEQLARAGAEVTALAVYSRLPPSVPDEVRERLSVLAAGDDGLASVVSSSDAVAALARVLASQPQVLAALRRGTALASHPRIADRLREAGYERVAECALDAAAIAAALREGGG